MEFKVEIKEEIKYEDTDQKKDDSSNPMLDIDMESGNYYFMEDIGLNDMELVEISTKELNKLLKRKNIPKPRQKEIKQRRRTLKNRGYAASCRVKRDEEEDQIKESIDDTAKKCDDLKFINDKNRDRIKDYVLFFQKEGFSMEEIRMKYMGGKYSREQFAKLFPIFYYSD